ncbi:MAG: HRDC domain-containing protein [Dehalococcoidia bacterium]|nr:HRDC domain-containing protein [Dehalococcoidia bacterium]
MTTEPALSLVAAPAEVAAIADAIRAAGAFALDLEFMTESRYVAELSLVQVSWGDAQAPEVRAIDPLRVDTRAIADLVGDSSVETVIHSAQADLALIGAVFGVRGRGIVDTQIAAAFLGLGDQIGYAPLVERMCGAYIDKGSQFTEWSRRPLTDEQIRYALDDVRYLPSAWQQLRAGLQEEGRLDWVMEECDDLAETWAERTPPEEMYRRIRGWNALRRKSQGALRALAAWREEEALRVNRPPSWLLNDRTMLEVARRPPRDLAELRAVRGLGEGTAQRYGQTLLEAVERGMEDPPPQEETPPRVPNLGQSWPAILSGIVQARCREASIAPRFVATRREIDDLIAWWLVGDRSKEPGLPLLGGWRRELVGADLLDWLQGKTAVIVDPDSEAGLTIRG